jgi:hypothetical protein
MGSEYIYCIHVWWFSQGTPVFSTNKTDCHDIAEILLKVALNTITVIKFVSDLRQVGGFLPVLQFLEDIINILAIYNVVSLLLFQGHDAYIETHMKVRG